MSVTGALLTYQRQITAWADTRGYRIEPATAQTAVRRRARREGGRDASPISSPTDDRDPIRSVARRHRSPSAPGRQLFVNPYTGAVLGEGNGQGGARRSSASSSSGIATSPRRATAVRLGRAITGASNLAFLFIVVSGLFLWWPRTWTWAALRSITWFKGGLPGKARDFNWHNTIGFWSAIPLAIIVAGGVVISYPWATALVYRAYGESAAGAGRSGRRGARSRRAGGSASREAAHGRTASAAISPVFRCEALVAKAETQMPDWKSISVALPAGNAPRVVLTLDAGDGGQPQKRATLTLDRRTGEVVRWEPFSSQSAGRRARTWLRFAHTGEVYG